MLELYKMETKSFNLTNFHYVRKILLLIGFGFFLPDFIVGQKPSLYKEIIQFIPSDLDKANQLAEKYLKKALKNQVDSSIAKANYALGLIYYYKDQHIISSKYYQNALNQEYSKTHIDFSEKCLNNLGVNYEILGKLEKSLTAYQQSLKIAEKRKDSFGIAQTWLNIALLKSKAGDNKSALILNQKAQDYFLKIENKEYIGLTYLNASVYYNSLDKLKAIENTLKGKIIFEHIKDTFNLIKSYSNLTLIYLDTKDFEKAEYYFNYANNLSDKFETHAFKSSILNHGIELYMQKKNLAQAMVLLKKSESNLSKYPNTEIKTQLLTLKVKLAVFEGNLPTFEQKFKEYEEANKQLIAYNFNSNYEEWSIFYEKEKLTKSIKYLTTLNKIKSKTMIIYTVIIIFLVLVLILLVILYLKLRDSYRKIFHLNNVPHFKLVQDKITPDTDGNDQKLYSLFLEIQQLMENEKFYLKPGITVSDISTAMTSNDKYISLSINKFARMNFNQYINTLRIQEAKILLLETNHESTVQKVAKACGFGNSSSFIRTFKQVTGLTPAFYVTLSKEIP